ncbi:MAG: hypothetical protein GY759_10470 [Chloroflexi bacterium]|nr:hypothetical protein [Chloroflexota bacterium]
MDHKERILAAIHHQPVDKIPSDMWATPEVQERLFDHFGIETAKGSESVGIGLNGGALTRAVEAMLELWERLGIDGILHISPPYIGPELLEEGDYSENEWGMGSRPQTYDTGSYGEQVYYPLAEAESITDLESYRWPDPDWYDYSALPQLAERCAGRAISLGYTAPFYYHNLLRGLELSLLDILLRPQFTHHLIGRISDFFTEYHRRCYEACHGLADITQVTDDFGSQAGLMISPQAFETFYRAPHQRAIDLAKSFDMLVLHHDDGDMRKLLPAFVDMGIDVLNPIQWRCGDWDLTALKADYGDHICFHSAVDNQQTLAFGTPDDVRAEVKHLMKTLGSDGTGFIIGPCHNIQPVTPTENIVALYEAALTSGYQR